LLFVHANIENLKPPNDHAQQPAHAGGTDEL
jgi:hypothetical protein